MSLRFGRACASWEESGGGWMERRRRTTGSCQTVRPTGDTVGRYPRTTQTTGSPGTALREETSSAPDVKSGIISHVSELLNARSLMPDLSGSHTIFYSDNTI